MKKTMPLAALALAAFALAGCKSTTQDFMKLPLDARIVPAKFKPIVEVMKDAGVAKGSAYGEKIFWIIPVSGPDKFASNSAAGIMAFAEDPMKAAAVYQACKSVGADILLAPRFTEERYASFLWFNKTRKVSVEGVPAKITGAAEIPVEDWAELFGYKVSK